MSQPFKIIADFSEALMEVDLSAEDRDILIGAALPAIQLDVEIVKNETQIPLGATKICGSPDLPPGLEWPTRPAYPDAAEICHVYKRQCAEPEKFWRWATPEQRQLFIQEALQRIHDVSNPSPLDFVAQINFKEMWATGSLDPAMPKTGILSIFYDMLEQPAGYDPKENCGFKILFCDNAEEDLVRYPIPKDSTIARDPEMFPACLCRASSSITIPTEHSYHFDSLPLSDSGKKNYQDWYEDYENEYSCFDQIGGWPMPVQSRMETECALVNAGHYCGNGGAFKDPNLAHVRATASDWMLLAQIATIDNTRICWGDCGYLYLWIKRTDLVARRFDQAHLIIQST